MRIVVLDAGTLGLAESQWNGFREYGELRLHDTTAADDATIVERLQGAGAVFTNKVPLRTAALERLPELRFIGVLATGYNCVDIAAARACGITVCNVPTYAAATTAQHAVALILELCNRVGLHDASVREGDWVRSSHFSYWKQSPLELEGRIVGIVGYGTIGKRVGAAVQALGAKVLASARRPGRVPESDGFAWADNDLIFRTADIVSLHCPETEETRGLVNRERLRSMKPGAMLVNTARGGLVDELALAEALREGPLRAAALDVLRSEPMAADCPLRGLPNCVITPHMAWAGESARQRLLQTALSNLRAFLQGGAVNQVT